MQPKKSEEAINSNNDVFPMPGSGSAEATPTQSTPEQPSPTPSAEPAESAPGGVNERYLSDPERSAGVGAPTLPTTISQTQPDPVAPATAPVVDPQNQDNNTPLIADDVDVIEKEWVDKAKEIIERTKDHPYRQEQEVERLQQSYLKKRYGKDVSSAN